MLHKISINNFRALGDIEINFEEKLTLIVGENDCGKSTVLDAIKICIGVIQNLYLDDFGDKTQSIFIVGEFDDFTIKQVFIPSNDQEDIQHTTHKIFTKENIERHKSLLNEYSRIEDENLRTLQIRQLAKLYSLNVRANSRNDTLIEQIGDIFEDPNISTDGIEINRHEDDAYFIGGQEFDDINSFVDQVFFKEKKKDIWSDTIGNDAISIEEHINQKLSSYSNDLKGEIEDSGVLNKIKTFIPDIEEIKIEAGFEKRAISLNVDVKLLKSSGEYLVKKLGDGSKRRLTMALLDLKKSQSNGEPTLYAFDEPDVHLHVSAQLELLNTIKDLADQGKQCILTTHSPFLINAASYNEIRIIEVKDHDDRIIKKLSTDQNIEYTLHRLGIENTNLFFSKRIILVEGETEEAFLPIAFKKTFGVSLNNKLVKLINVRGIHNIPGFASAMTEMIESDYISILMDNDGTENLNAIIDNLGISYEQIFRIGNKEFEDSFADEQIYNSWCNYCTTGRIGENWSEENISVCRQSCDEEGKKFSKELKALNQGGTKMPKPELGQALATYIDSINYPEQIKEFLNQFDII
ncbi:MAG TPA: AAA family ATPase [Balneolales bacterium]|nr:AAA family ATPase [Balneolales bacterium]